MESSRQTSGRHDTSFCDTSHLEYKRDFHEHKGHGSVVDQRNGFDSAAAYRSRSSSIEDAPYDASYMQRSYRGKSGRGVYHKLMSGKVLEDKGWLAAAMILGLLASYPLVIKPLHQVSTDMLSKMRGNLKTGAI